MARLEGRVVTGVGNFGYWIERLREHYRHKTGMLLFPGTLNIKLCAPYDLPASRHRLEAEEYGGAVSVNIVPCTILGKKAVILRTDKADSEEESRKILEVASEVRLRDEFNLQDGDLVEVDIAD